MVRASAQSMNWPVSGRLARNAGEASRDVSGAAGGRADRYPIAVPDPGRAARYLVLWGKSGGSRSGASMLLWLSASPPRHT